MLAVLALCAIAALVVVVVKFTNILSRLSESNGRASERNEHQRDRFSQTLIEKLQARTDEDAIRLANLHASEGREAHVANLRRDTVPETTEDRRAKRAAEAEMRLHTETRDDPNFTKADAQA